MAFNPFTTIGEKLAAPARELVSGVGAVTVVWAHVELALDMLIAVIGNLPNAAPPKRHPIGLSAKTHALFVAMRDRPELKAYKGELLQIHSLSDTLGQSRHDVVHGAMVATLTDTEFEFMKLTRVELQDEISKKKVTIHQMFVLVESSVELGCHIYNLTARLIEQFWPEHAGTVADLKTDVSKFNFPAINPGYKPRK